MYTISNDIKNEITINKSKFICVYKKVYNEEDALIFIDSIKNLYKDATHYCYSYIIDNTKRFNDDGEPGGTAGIPILNVLENNNLNYIVCIVIRYFGGIKLGAGGLVRAYSKSASECLKTAIIKEIVPGKNIKIIFSYDKVKLIDNTLKDIDIKDKIFNENITYIFDISNIKLDKIKEILNSNVIEFNISKDILIEE
jgi:uncharacterized YigZ family protein